jgi:phosphoserine phosphatase RsbX
MHLRTATLTRPCHGFVANGDVAVIRIDGPHAILGVVDALGHGPAAAEVADRAQAFLDEVRLEAADPAELLQALHAELRGSRGAVASVCCFDGHMLRSAGVGNVEVRGLGIDPGLVCAPGVLGRRVRAVRTASTTVSPGGRIAMFSDGISGRVDLASLRMLDPESACKEALASFGRATDDATILIFDVHAS